MKTHRFINTDQVLLCFTEKRLFDTIYDESEVFIEHIN